MEVSGFKRMIVKTNTVPFEFRGGSLKLVVSKIKSLKIELPKIGHHRVLSSGVIWQSVLISADLQDAYVA